MSKICNQCQEDKPLSKFYHYKNGKSYSVCIKCKNKSNKTKWDDVQRNSQYLRKYGISLDSYNKMFAKQKGCCAICGRNQSEFNRRLHVDHSHTTNKVRGLLCVNCNKVVGILENYQGKLKQYYSYINRF